MSRRLGIVVEGKTDIPIIEAVCTIVLGDDTDVVPLHPYRDEITKKIQNRGGHSQVKLWCKQNRNIDNAMKSYFVQALFIMLDFDIAKRYNCSTVDELQSEMRSWVYVNNNKVFFAVAVRAIESWIIAILYPDGSRTDLIINPFNELRSNRPDGLNKTLNDYEQLAAEILENQNRFDPQFHTNSDSLNAFINCIDSLPP